MLRSFGSRASLVLLVFGLSACGNGGRINFDPGFSTNVHKVPGYNMVPASEALTIEQGKTIANGYHAKVQLNNMSGTKLVSGAYTAKMKFTTRHR